MARCKTTKDACRERKELGYIRKVERRLNRLGKSEAKKKKTAPTTLNEQLHRLNAAVKSGNFSKTKKLLKVGPKQGCTRALVNTEFQGRLPLHMAIENEYGCIVELLLKNGADVNEKDQEGVAPLLKATMSQRRLWRSSTRIMRLLLAYRADVNCTQDDGISCLMCSAYKGETEKAELLLANGANPCQKSCYGQDVFSYAMCAYVHATPLPLHMLQLLLRAAGVNSHDKYGFTSLIAVCNEEDKVPPDKKTKHEVVVKDLKVLAAVRFLIGNRASVNKKDINCNTALYYAAVQGLAKTTQCLLAHDADPYPALQITRQISSQPKRSLWDTGIYSCPGYMDNIKTIRLLLKMAVVKEHTTGQQNVTTIILPGKVGYFSKSFKSRVALVSFMMCKLPEEERGNVIRGKRKSDESTRGLNIDICSLILRDLFLLTIHEY